MLPVHDRMPVIIGDNETACWLGEEPCEAEALLKPFPEARMAMWPVGKAVGSVKNQGRELAEPITL
jgi:putative SOS response-associated peptidase YedK